jgi:hypothetical protein
MKFVIKIPYSFNELAIRNEKNYKWAFHILFDVQTQMIRFLDATSIT